jgi:phenylpyruvate tautomerase
VPLLKIQTNIGLEQAAGPALLKQLSKTVASELGKPERYVMVTIETDVTMLFAGSDQPTAYLELKSLDLPEEKSAELSKALCAAIAQTLSIASDRIYIEFSSPARHMWGWKGATF